MLPIIDRPITNTEMAYSVAAIGIAISAILLFLKLKRAS